MSFENMFATHPPLEDRIQRLQNLGGVSMPPPPEEPPPGHHGPWG